MIEWGKVPWPLWVYVAMTTVGMVVVVLTVSGSTPAAALILFVVGILAWNFFLLRALRWLWIATVVGGVVFLVFNLATATGTWYGDLQGLVGLTMLLLPAARRFFGEGEAAAAA